MDIKTVEVSKKAEKQLGRVPLAILNKFISWVEAIELSGINEVRKIPGFHDEPLKGKRKGQRSIRLNRSYRANLCDKNGYCRIYFCGGGKQP